MCIRDRSFSSYSISFLTDDIIRMRYVEIDGELCQIMMVVKMRRTAHSREIRKYQITTDGIVIGERLKNYVDLITGIPQPVSACLLYTSRRGVGNGSAEHW